MKENENDSFPDRASLYGEGRNDHEWKIPVRTDSFRNCILLFTDGFF